MKLSFFKTPKPRKYKYIPRYYDPKKEEMDKRKLALEDRHEDREAVGYRISTGLRYHYNPEARSSKSNQVRRSNLRLIASIVFLLFVGYFLLQNSFIGEWLIGVYGG